MIDNGPQVRYVSVLNVSSSGGGGGGGGTINGTIANTQVAYGTASDTIGGENDFTYDATNNILTVEKILSQVIIQVNNPSGSTIAKGSAVYVSADGSTIPQVALADASDSAKMPSVAIISNSIGAGANGYGVLTGTINGLDGSAGNTVFDSTISASDVGSTLYVSPTNAGRLTKTKPTGSTQLIQNVGRIIDVNGGNVKIAINNIGRSNDVPNSFSTTGNIDAGSLTVNSAYTFPTSDGTSGQVLSTDGAGTLTFGDSSVSSSYVADETIAVGELLRVVNSNDAPLTPGRTVLSSSTDLVNSAFLGIALDTGNQGDTIGVATSGKVQIKFSSAPASSSNGQKVYVSGTGGIATLTAPTGSGNVVYQVGVLVGANGVSTTPLVDLNFQEIIVID